MIALILTRLKALEVLHPLDRASLELSRTWQQIESGAALTWRAWSGLFPQDSVWQPYGAIIAGVFMSLVFVWLLQKAKRT